MQEEAKRMARQLPLVVVLGATACGKSKLAIELARRFGGEIISADSMQVYHGLDIVTNKVTKEEQQLAKHHMIDFLNPLHRYSVVDFRTKSLEIIEKLKEKNSLPIIVGGTNYYIESLIWKEFLFLSSDHKSIKRSSNTDEDKPNSEEDFSTLLDTEVKTQDKLPSDSFHSEEDLEDIEKFFKKRIYLSSFTNVANEKLWNILEQVDEESAHYFHPNDKRRIIRCLQVIQEKRKNYSQLLKDVNKSSQEGQASLGGPLRFEPTCVLWLSCDSSCLDKILDERVDQMLNRGLLSELEGFHEEYNRQRITNGEKPDYSIGIFQTIGFKEFHNYLILDSDAKSSEEGDRILKKSIFEMKLSTRRYAKRQLKWIRRRFLQAGTRDLPPVFKLSTTLEEEKWCEQVREPAFEIVSSLIEGRPLNDKVASLRQHPEKQIPNTPGKFYCEACDRTFIGTNQINDHQNSKSHKKKMDDSRSKKQRVEF